jgi:hypothetical protein
MMSYYPTSTALSDLAKYFPLGGSIGWEIICRNNIDTLHFPKIKTPPSGAIHQSAIQKRWPPLPKNAGMRDAIEGRKHLL